MTDKKIEAAEAGCVTLLSGAGAGMIAWVLFILATRDGWNWYLAPFFSLPHITFLQAMLGRFIVSVMTHSNGPDFRKEVLHDEPLRAVQHSFAYMLIGFISYGLLALIHNICGPYIAA